MLLYTPVPIEQVLEGINEKHEYQEIDVDGIKLVVEPIDTQQAKIIRLISSNPRDYLNSDYAPGTTIQFKL